MRILYHHRTKADDGQAVHIRSLQRAFAGLGHEVFEVGLVEHGQGDARSTAPEDPSASTSENARGKSWNWVDRIPNGVRELLELGYTVPGRWKVAKELDRIRPDFVYERYAFGNAGGVLAARARAIPIYLEVNSPMALELSRTRGLRFPGLARRSERFVLTRATRVLCVTQVLADLLAAEGVPPEKMLVTPNGVDLESYAEPFDPVARAEAERLLGLESAPPSEAGAARGCVLGFVGYYRDWHRLDLALEALTQPGLERAQLVLVGEGPAREGLERRAKELNVTDRLRFAGKRAHSEIPRLLPAFDIGLVPAINSYASPLKLHEYMAAGLACVAPDQPNLREVLQHDHDAVLVPPGDPEAFSSAVLELARDPNRVRRLGLAARGTVESRELTWAGNARRVCELHATIQPSKP